MALLLIVHAAGATTAEAQKAKSAPTAAQQSPPVGAAPVVRYGTEGLPVQVIEMREAILAAVRSGVLEELRTPIEMNEIKPSIDGGAGAAGQPGAAGGTAAPVRDPIALLRSLSADGEGRDILAAIGAALEAGYTVAPLGRDLENNRIYVWPYFAEAGIGTLTPAQEAELAKLVTPEAAAQMRARGGRYTHWRLGIAADGTWHMLTRP